jgi:AraC-like DNA-binding protein
VRYLQIFLNQPQGYLFCLVEGPDKESCAKVHEEAHGNIACNILEITESDFSALLGTKQKDALDFTRNHDGTLDTGNRAIVAVNLLGVSGSSLASKAMVNDIVRNHRGKKGDSLEKDVVAVFHSCSDAIDAAVGIRDNLLRSAPGVEVRIGVDIGPPLKEKGNFFEEVCRSASLFSFISRDGGITVSSKVMQLCSEHGRPPGDFVKAVSAADEKFLSGVMTCLEALWQESEITIAGFAKQLGTSKSQLARRLSSLAGLSPNDFVKEFRLRKAVDLMADHTMNVAEVTMAVGYTNPSYFAKCFRKRFGHAPSSYQVQGKG